MPRRTKTKVPRERRQADPGDELWIERLRIQAHIRDKVRDRHNLDPDWVKGRVQRRTGLRWVPHYENPDGAIITIYERGGRPIRVVVYPDERTTDDNCWKLATAHRVPRPSGRRRR